MSEVERLTPADQEAFEAACHLAFHEVAHPDVVAMDQRVTDPERTFAVREGNRESTFRLAIHHEGDEGELDSFARDVEKIVREEREVFGELAPYDGGTYTFIADYLPWGNGDGMEHRNSTIMTSSSCAMSRRASSWNSATL